MLLIDWLLKIVSTSKRQTSLEKGAYYERKACRYLQRRGLRLISKNFCCLFGEVDLIMRDQAYLVFVEVRYRYHHQIQNSLESIDEYKQQRLYRVGEYYLQTIKDPEHPCRYDFVGFDGKNIEWIKDAF